MKKDFILWHNKKAYLDHSKTRAFFHEREIWFCHLGVNIGFEQDGKGSNFGRPVLIIKKFNNEIFWAIPLTTKNKVGKYYFSVDLKDDTERKAILSQLKLIDAKRLYQKITFLEIGQFENLICYLASLLMENFKGDS